MTTTVYFGERWDRRMTGEPHVINKRVVYRYPVDVIDYQVITMPVGAQILHVDRRDGTDTVDLWALVDPEAPAQGRSFRIAGTGQPIVNGDKLRHVGTFQLRDGALVFHVFEGGDDT